MEPLTPNSFDVFGIPFCADRREHILSQVRRLAERKRPSSVIFANAHVVVEAHRSPKLKNAIKNASMVIPDGVPIAWMLKAKGQREATRYSGPDLMEDVFRAEPSSTHFFLGSTHANLERIRQKFKGNAVGFYSPPFSTNGFAEGELSKQIDMIERVKPDFVWVGLGAPKQEYYVSQMTAKVSGGVWLAVGAAFDYYAGRPRAPKLMQKMGLEWAFRFASEPRRLWKRYVVTNPAFIRLALAELLNSKDQRDCTVRAPDGE